VLVKELEELENKKADIENLAKVYNDRMKSINKVVENVSFCAVTWIFS
jgi:hypothetical protein